MNSDTPGNTLGSVDADRIEWMYGHTSVYRDSKVWQMHQLFAQLINVYYALVRHSAVTTKHFTK